MDWTQDDIDDGMFDDGDPEEEEFEDALGNCAIGSDGLCGKAGSEECDFECLIMADIIRRSASRKARTK